MIRVSVVIPTYNRAELVRRNILALAEQTMASDDFEVIVVADGCEDNTSQLLASLDVPFQLRIIEQAESGAATARNAGAKQAKGTLLVFLDDDMRADPELLKSHWEGQRDIPCLLVGFFSTPPAWRSEHPLAASGNVWWDNRFRRMSQPGYRHTYRDVCTGNMSVSRTDFLATGCFNEELGRRAGEDYEFGIRWLKRGGKIRYQSTALSWHLDSPSIDKALLRVYNEGRGHVILLREHPEFFSALQLKSAIEGQPWVKFKRLIKVSRNRSRLLVALLKPLLRLSAAMKFRRLFKKSFRVIHSARYWAGVLAESDGIQNLRNLIQDLPGDQVPEEPLEVQIGLSPEQLSAIIAERQPRELGLLADETPVCWIADEPGLEPIDWPHVLRKLEYSLDANTLRKLPHNNRRDAQLTQVETAQ